MTRRTTGPLLAIDTATRSAVVAVGEPVGRGAHRRWAVGHRHGETLLPMIEEALVDAGIGLGDLLGIVVGIGPGSFTGLRVGLTVAKTMAYGLSLPIAGIGTLEALALASGSRGEVHVVLPAGPSDRYVAQYRIDDGTVTQLHPPRLAPPGEPVATDGDDATFVAVDLEETWFDEATRQRGAVAVERLGPVLLQLGAARLAAGGDEAATLVPAYVTLPRGLAPALVESEWSPDLR